MTAETNAGAIAHNISVHERIARKYEKVHGEICNEIEQERLREALRRALETITTDRQHPVALDFGCGAGNLTRHLVDLGARVISADVSRGFLDLVSERYGDAIDTHLLNGRDLSGFADASVDMIATYSVLHHIPDYLGLLDHFARVVRPGGVIFIDHEQSPSYWSDDGSLATFRSQALKVDWQKYLTPKNYVDRVKRVFNPRYSAEGDIHVWPDDHIEWDRIEARMETLGFKPVLRDDYLLYRRLYRPDVFAAHRDKLNDMRMMTFRREN